MRRVLVAADAAGLFKRGEFFFEQFNAGGQPFDLQLLLIEFRAEIIQRSALLRKEHFELGQPVVHTNQPP